MKTIKEWFETLPEPIRSQALKNGLNDVPNTMHVTTSSLESALDAGFVWDDTPEKHSYWESIADRAKSGEFN